MNKDKALGFFGGVFLTVMIAVCCHFFMPKDTATIELALYVTAIVTLLGVSGSVLMAARAWEEVGNERKHFFQIEAEAGDAIRKEYEKKYEEDMQKKSASYDNYFQAGYRCGYRDCKEGLPAEYEFED